MSCFIVAPTHVVNTTMLVNVPSHKLGDIMNFELFGDPTSVGSVVVFGSVIHVVVHRFDDRVPYCRLACRPGL